MCLNYEVIVILCVDFVLHMTLLIDCVLQAF